MNVAVNINFLQHNQSFYAHYCRQLLLVLTQQLPNINFIFFTDEQANEKFIVGPNCKEVIVKSLTKKKSNDYYWHNILLPLAAKKHKANIIIHFNGKCCLTTSTPQLLVVQQTNNHQQPILNYYRKKSIKKATKIIALAAFIKNEIVAQQKNTVNKIDIIYPANNDEVKPLSYTEKSAIKDTYTNGAEYFICTDGLNNINNTVQLLKAFSLFKKRLNSQMKLLLNIKDKVVVKQVQEKLSTYKYKTDVVIINNKDTATINKLIAGAYCIIYPFTIHSFPFSVITSLQAGVPLICNEQVCFEELAGKACLAYNTDNEQNIADKMMLLYKDENLRNNLIEQGITQSAMYNWSNITDGFYNTLQTIAK